MHLIALGDGGQFAERLCKQTRASALLLARAGTECCDEANMHLGGQGIACKKSITAMFTRS